MASSAAGRDGVQPISAARRVITTWSVHSASANRSHHLMGAFDGHAACLTGLAGGSAHGARELADARCGTVNPVKDAARPRF